MKKDAGGPVARGELPARTSSADEDQATGESFRPSYTPDDQAQPMTIPGSAVIMNLADASELREGDYMRMASPSGMLLGWLRVSEVEVLYDGAGPVRVTYQRPDKTDGAIILERQIVAYIGADMAVSGIQIARPVTEVEPVTRRRKRRRWRFRR